MANALPVHFLGKAATANLLYAFPLPAVVMLVATLIDGRLAIVVGGNGGGKK